MKTVVTSINTSLREIKETVSLKVMSVLQKLDRPLPLELPNKHCELIVEIGKDCENIQNITHDTKYDVAEILQYSRNSAAVLNSTADHILASIEKDFLNKQKAENSEMRELILQLNANIDSKFHQLENKVTVEISTLKSKINSLHEKESLRPQQCPQKKDFSEFPTEIKTANHSKSNQAFDRDSPPC